MKKLLCALLAAVLLLTCCAAVAEPIAMRGRGVYNILLVGTDAYSDDETGRSDTMIVLQIDSGRGTIRLASLLRDLYVDIPGHGGNRLNAAYVFGGPELLTETLETNFGVVVDGWAEVNFERLARIIDSMGGVTVEISEAERTQANGILRTYNKAIGKAENDGLIAQAGEVKLTGKQALCFARIRKIDSDFERTARQRRVLEAVFRQAMSMDYFSLAGVAMGNLDAVNMSFGLGDLLGMIPAVLGCKGAAFETLTIPGQGMYHDETINGMMVLVPDKSACRDALENFFAIQ